MSQVKKVDKIIVTQGFVYNENSRFHSDSM